ncbi:MAG: RICIN domain-containing protein, partial [Luteolibacter sp.]
SFEATFDWYHSLNSSKWALGTQIPKLGDVRGKIVLVRRFGAINSKGIDASYWPDNRSFQSGSIDVQDNYQVGDNETKWSQISSALSAASNQVRADILHLNFCSGYRSFLGIPNITNVSNSINPRVESYFASAAPGHYGCVIMDFATAARSAAIYNANLPPPLAEDVYRIVNRNSGKVLEIPAGNTANGVRATQGEWSGANHQRWKIKHLGAGNYRITALHSGKVLDLAGSSANNGAQLVQWPDAGGTNQHWHLLPNGDGSHRFLNLSSGKALEITAAATNDGALSQQWSWENLEHQKWIIEAANLAPAFKNNPVEGADARSGSAYRGSLVGTAADPDIGDSESSLRFEKIGGPSWLNVSATGTLSGTPSVGDAGFQVFDIRVSDRAGASSQGKLAIIVLSAPLAAGTYRLVNQLSGRVLDVAESSTDAGSGLIQFDWTGNNNQRWKLQELENGCYQISAIHSGLSLDVFGSSLENGGSVIQWPYAGGANQQWYLFGSTQAGYRIVNRNSRKVLEVADAATGNLATIQQWDWGSVSHQQWQIEIANSAPEFSTARIDGKIATAEVDFQDSLVAYASDPDPADSSERLRFFKINGPAWLSVASDGAMSGRPGKSDVGTHEFTIELRDTTDASTQAIVKIQVANSAWQAWQLSHFGDDVENQDHAGGYADPDHDGTVNLLEYAMGTDPLVVDQRKIKYQFSRQNSHWLMRCEVTRNPEAIDLEWAMETSINSLDSDAWSSSDMVIESNLPNLWVVSHLSPHPRRYYRLRVSRPQ